MSDSEVTTGHGSELHINVGAGMVAVAEVDDIPELPSSSRELYETTHLKTLKLKSWKKQPLGDGNEITITGNYVIGSTSDATLTAADEAEGSLPYMIVLTQDDDVWHVTGQALFYNYKRGNSKDSKRVFEITLKPVDVSATAEAA